MTLEEGFEIRYRYSLPNTQVQTMSVESEDNVRRYLKWFEQYKGELALLEVHTVRTEYNDVTAKFLKEAPE